MTRIFMEGIGSGTIISATIASVFIAAGGFLLAWLNNGKQLQERINILTSQLFKNQDDLLGLERRAGEAAAKAFLDQAACLSREQDLKEELRMQGLRIKVLESGQASPIPLMAGIVVADLSGTIKEFSAGLTPILKYLPKEVIGKKIEILIPPDFLDQHAKGFALATVNPETINSMKEIITYALDKTGARVPVAITLLGWKTDRGDGYITATIRQRASSPSGESGAYRTIPIPKP